MVINLLQPKDMAYPEQSTMWLQELWDRLTDPSQKVAITFMVNDLKQSIRLLVREW